jgi:hypothetical protein
MYMPVKFTGFRIMLSSGMLRRVVLVRTEVLEYGRASLIRMRRTGELGNNVSNN